MTFRARLVAFYPSAGTQLLVYAAISAVVLLGTALLTSYNRELYQPFFAFLNPLLVLAGFVILGGLLFALLVNRAWLFVYRHAFPQGVLVALFLASLFAATMILLDWLVRLPADLNRPFPASLLFYPTIAFVVEILFHVLPLTLLLLLLTSFFPAASVPALLLPAILFVAFLEPIFQTWIGFSREYPFRVTALVALIIYLINLCQLLIFRRFDFVSMLTLRLTYYLLWHIVWGVLRLRLFFPR